MKRLVRTSEHVFGMANLVPEETGLPCDIWSDHKGVQRNVPHSDPRLKISADGIEISVFIGPNPRILAKPSHIPFKVKKKLKKGIEYVKRNYDLFLRHYNDVNNEFTDIKLMKALADRGDFKM